MQNEIILGMGLLVVSSVLVIWFINKLVSKI